MRYRQSIMKKSMVMCLATAMVVGQVVSFADIKLPTRNEAPDKYKWDLTEIYASRDAFNKDIDLVRKELLPQYKAFQGTLSSAEKIKAFLELDEKVGRLVTKAQVYSQFASDLNQSDSKGTEMLNTATALASEYGQATSFAAPEILALKGDDLEKIKNNPILADYKMYLERLLKKKPHTLSKDAELILSNAGEMAATPNDVFSKATLGDFKTPVIKDAKGKDIKLTTATYSQINEGKDRAMRKKAYDARMQAYAAINNTLSAAYIGEIKKNVFFAKSRNYSSALEASLDAEYIPKNIYDNLVSSVNSNLKYLHRYYSVMKKYGKYDKLYLYDINVPLVNDYKMEYSYDDANKMIETALAPLGTTYVQDYDKGIKGRWLDVYEDSNKYTGGYQWGSYDTHPYILLNWDNSLDAALTTAHEMGHALNTYYSNKTQKFVTADYPIFTAEVASTTNEMVTMDYLIKHAKNEKEKLYLINSQINNIKGSVYQQVMYSEFEMKAHQLYETNQPISAEVLNNLWESLVKKYYGPAFTSDPNLKYGWTRIPHFYMNFYVYKYATSMAAAYSISNNLVNDKDGKAKENYLKFLGAGGSAFPVEMLKNTGVDMTTSKPVDDVLTYFDSLVTEMEKLLDKQAKGQLK